MAKSKLSKHNAVIASTTVIGGTSLTVGILSLPSIGTIGLTGLAAASIPPIAITLGALIIAGLIAGGIWYACCKKTTTADKQDLVKKTKLAERLDEEDSQLAQRADALIQRTIQIRLEQAQNLEWQRAKAVEREKKEEKIQQLREELNNIRSSTRHSAISLSGNPNALHSTATQHSDTTLLEDAQGISTESNTANCSSSTLQK